MNWGMQKIGIYSGGRFNHPHPEALQCPSLWDYPNGE